MTNRTDQATSQAPAVDSRGDWLDVILGGGGARNGAAVVSDDGESVSFTELAARVGGLQAALAAHGLVQGDRVVIELERSVSLIVAMLAVLDAGLTYVVLDPGQPAARRASIAVDCGAALRLTTASGDGPPRLAPSDWPRSGARRPARREPDDLAYIAYTSGSTGTPKGVAVPHGALAAYLDWCVATLPFRGDGVPLFATAAFDHAVTCIYPPLIKSEPVKLLPPVGAGQHLGTDLLERGPYSYVKATPSHLRFLSAEQRGALGSSALLVMLGGERSDAALVRSLRTDSPTVRIMNHYGPTEATVGCLTYEISPGAERDPVPIGFPMPHVDVRIEAGELVVGGVCAAAGYWNAAEARVDSGAPFSLADGKRWYRTGDQVAVDEDGVHVYLGRGDRQVKHLGQRIELDEIEHALVAVPTVDSAAAISVSDGLCAVVAPLVGAAQDEIKEALREVLPPAAVPRRIVRVDGVPVTPNGKRDVAAIGALVAVAAPVASDARSALAKIWCQILELEEVRDEMDFFDEGGDSLAVVELAEAIADELGQEIELGMLFENARFDRFVAAFETTTNAEVPDRA